MTVPTPDQVAKALDAARREFRAFVALCAFAGLRLGEAPRTGPLTSTCPATSSQDAAGCRARCGQAADLPSKAGSERDAPIPESLTDHLTAVGTLRRGGLALPVRQRIAQPQQRHPQWRRIRARIGMDELTLHDLRHFYATGPIAAGRRGPHAFGSGGSDDPVRTGCGLAVPNHALSANDQVSGSW